MYELLFTALLLPKIFSNVHQMHTTQHAIVFVAFRNVRRGVALRILARASHSMYYEVILQ
jgi:hypothetical protein